MFYASYEEIKCQIIWLISSSDIPVGALDFVGPCCLSFREKIFKSFLKGLEASCYFSPTSRILSYSYELFSPCYFLRFQLLSSSSFSSSMCDIEASKRMRENPSQVLHSDSSPRFVLRIFIITNYSAK